MIDICKFLNSKDIASYLRETGYKFTAPEAAFIVYQSHDATLEERAVAWLKIAGTMPDCPMEGRLNMRPIPSFHAFLHDYVESQKRELERFFEPTGFVYSLSWYEGGYVEDGDLFGNAEDCIAYIREHQGKDCCGNGVPSKYRLKKRSIDQMNPCGDSELCLNRDMKVLSVYCAGKSEAENWLSLQFEGMWFTFPTPFKRGDIVVDPKRRKQSPLVLDYLPTWGKEECVENGLDESDWRVQKADWRINHLMKTGDTTDMDSRGFFLSEDRSLTYDDNRYSYLDLEYWDGELKDENRWAAVVSAHLKREIDFVECANLLRFLGGERAARAPRRVLSEGILSRWDLEQDSPRRE